MVDKNTFLRVVFFAVFTVAIATYAYASNIWGYGNTKEEACSNAKAIVRSKGCIYVGGRPVMSECECDTLTPDRSWKCNVDFSCKKQSSYNPMSTDENPYKEETQRSWENIMNDLRRRNPGHWDSYISKDL
jgi:hypothetical protein